MFPDRFVVCVSQLPVGRDLLLSQKEELVCMKSPMNESSEVPSYPKTMEKKISIVFPWLSIQCVFSRNKNSLPILHGRID